MWQSLDVANDVIAEKPNRAAPELADLGHLDWFGHHPDVTIGAICDVYQPHLDLAVAKTGGKAKG